MVIFLLAKNAFVGFFKNVSYWAKQGWSNYYCILKFELYKKKTWTFFQSAFISTLSTHFGEKSVILQSAFTWSQIKALGNFTKCITVHFRQPKIDFECCFLPRYTRYMDGEVSLEPSCRSVLWPVFSSSSIILKKMGE